MKRLIITLAAAATAAGASAQQWGGLLMDKDLLMPTDMIELSQTQFNFGTARAMAMAGAFTSLGADLSSMSINPAGLGMYRHGDISITPMMSFARSKGNAPEYGRNSRCLLYTSPQPGPYQGLCHEFHPKLQPQLPNEKLGPQGLFHP